MITLTVRTDAGEHSGSAAECLAYAEAAALGPKLGAGLHVLSTDDTITLNFLPAARRLLAANGRAGEIELLRYLASIEAI